MLSFLLLQFNFETMAVIDLVLGFLKVVTIVYDIVTFPIYGITQQSWKDRTKQNLGPVSWKHGKDSIIDSAYYSKFSRCRWIMSLKAIKPLRTSGTRDQARSIKRSLFKAKLILLPKHLTMLLASLVIGNALVLGKSWERRMKLNQMER